MMFKPLVWGVRTERGAEMNFIKVYLPDPAFPVIQ